MKFFIRNNKDAKNSWKLLSKLLSGGFIILLFVNVLFKINNSNYRNSEYIMPISYFILSLGILGFALDVIHWLKPNWFEKESSIEL